MIVVPPGTTARLKWRISIDIDPSQSTLLWYFTRRSAGSKEELIATIFRNIINGTYNSSLPGVATEKPATLVLKNVNCSYNGKYRFAATMISTGNIVSSESSVELFVAGKFFYELRKTLDLICHLRYMRCMMFQLVCIVNNSTCLAGNIPA